MVATGTLGHADGIEVGGLELAQSTQGSPSILGSIASPAGRSGAFAVRLNPAATQEQYETWGSFAAGGTPGSVGNTHYLVGFAVRFSDLTPGTEYAFMTVRDDQAPNVLATFSLTTGGNLQVDNQPGTGILTETTPFTVNQWHYIEFAYQPDTTGVWEVWLDGTSLGSGTSDFLVLSTNLRGVLFGGAGSGDGNVDIDDAYLVHHTVTLQGNNLGPSEVFPYQGQSGGAGADAGLTTNDDAITGAVWNDVGETPLNSASFGAFTASPSDGATIFNDAVTGNNGHDQGPTSGPYTVTGTIQGAMWLGIYQRGTGGGSTHVMWYGEGSQSPISSFNMDTIENSADTFRAIVSEAAGPVPTSAQSFAMGAGTTGAQDIEIREQFAFLLHTPIVVTEIPPGLGPVVAMQEPHHHAGSGALLRY